jgi:hypothetical protein
VTTIGTQTGFIAPVDHHKRTFHPTRTPRARHYKLIPLKPRSKEPIYKEWQARPTDLNEFTPNLNVGIVLGTPSGNLTDIDLDHPAAIIAAPYLLPETGAIFGRASKRSSHREYRTEEAGRTIQLRGSDGRMIVELRANGAQTMVPSRTGSRPAPPGRSSRRGAGLSRRSGS